MPSEVFGWYLLNFFMWMEPSDVANVRGRAENYKLDSVINALQRMWSGNGLSAKDQELKRRKGSALVVEDGHEHGGGEVYQHEVQDEHAATPDHDEEFDDITAWYQDAFAQFMEEPNEPEILANFKGAQKALDQAKVARGFFPVRNPNYRGKGKGRGKGNYNQENPQCRKDLRAMWEKRTYRWFLSAEDCKCWW